MDSRYETGMKIRTEVLGTEHVARAKAQQTDLDADFQRFITETAWGTVWARPNLDRRTRSLVTIALLAALGRDELALHLRASRTSESTRRRSSRSCSRLPSTLVSPPRIRHSRRPKPSWGTRETIVDGPGRDPTTFPPYYHEAYRSTVRRAPGQPLVPVPHTLSEIT